MARPLAASEYISWMWTLPSDLYRRRRSEAFQSQRATYAILRRLYAWTGGRSRHAIRAMFRSRRPAQPQIDARGTSIVNELRERGIAVAKSYVPPDQRARIRAFLESRDAVRRNGVRDDYRPQDLLDSPDIRALIADPFIHDIAAAYLGCTPIFTQVSAWRSRPDAQASADDLSEAAQLYHYDYDWPAFVKFFIYLTDVGPANGPFTFVVGTHEQK